MHNMQITNMRIRLHTRCLINTLFIRFEMAIVFVKLITCHVLIYLYLPCNLKKKKQTIDNYPIDLLLSLCIENCV